MKISKEKKEKISEQILAFLFSRSPKPAFTFHVAREIARDEEFVKELLRSMKKKGLVNEINKNSEGVIYRRRARWSLSDKAYSAYKSASNLN